MVVHRFDTITHIWLILIWFDILYVNIYIKYWICVLYGLHVVFINRNLPINNKTHIKVVLHSLILYFSFSYFLHYQLYFITRYQYNVPTNWTIVEVFFLSSDSALHVFWIQILKELHMDQFGCPSLTNLWEKAQD